MMLGWSGWKFENQSKGSENNTGKLIFWFAFLALITIAISSWNIPMFKRIRLLRQTLESF
jgi:hypothetical protein